ncbi:MAG TPA: class I SAM-dependent methyltransferase [Thermoleophilaceae bacterium]|jgi:SAM-dependent methyltransferase
MAFLRRAKPQAADLDAELRWWLESWDPVIRDGGFNPGDVPAFLDPGEPVADSYDGRRRQIARAEVRRVLREAGIEDPGFFAGKVVVDIGPGPLGFPDACGARVSIGVEPLAERFAAAGLLIPDSEAVYLAVGAEEIPLVSGTVDVALSRNSLDHVRDPAAVVAEVRRILRPGGDFILNVDLDHPATATEPHTFTRDKLVALLEGFEIERELAGERAHGHEGSSVVIVARTPA